jgi:tight adherence protein B
MLGLLLFQSLFIAFVTTVMAGAVPFMVLSIAVSRRAKRLQSQLADVLMILASSLRAGHSFLQALDSVSQEASEPAAGEFARAVAEIRLGRSLTEALEDLADRVDSDDFKWAILAVTIQREVGGNLAEVLDTVASTMRERDVVRRQVDVLSAEGKLSIYVLTALPIILSLYMAIVNPEYLSLLWTTQIGVVMLITGSALLTIGLMWMRKVVKIHV